MKLHLRCFSVATLSGLLGIGCDSRSSQSDIEHLRDEVETLRTASAAATASLKSDIALLKFEASSSRDMLLDLITQHDLNPTVALDPMGKGFAFLPTDNGLFLVSCSGAEPFLDGHKLHLEVGNAMNVVYTGFKLHVEYGPVEPTIPPRTPNASNTVANLMKWDADNKAWLKSLRKTDVAFVEYLKPGQWNRVDLVLPATKPEEVRYVKIGISVDGVALSSQKSQ